MDTPTIKELRKSLGLSQEAFAKAIGKSYASVRNYEDGRNLPSDVMGKMLALAVKAGLSDLAGKIDTEAAALYDRPLQPQSVEESKSEEESPEARQRAHAILDYILDGAAPSTARSLLETLRMYYVALRSMGDPFIDLPEQYETGPDPRQETESRRARYRVLMPVSLGDGVVHQSGEVVMLDLATAKEYSHALVSLEEDEAQSPGKKIA